MSFFVRLDKPPPLQLFASTMRTGRPAFTTGYVAAFAAANRRNEAIDEMYRASGARAAELHVQAYTDDLIANRYASLLLLTADDALQRLGRSLSEDGKAPGLKNGFGPQYNGVPLTTLLHATTNALRHVSEWDELETLTFPYTEADTSIYEVRRAMESISVLVQALGIGKTDRIYAAPCFHVVVVIDGLYGTHPIAYERFEDAIFAAAREIVAAGDAELLPLFEQLISE